MRGRCCICLHVSFFGPAVRVSGVGALRRAGDHGAASRGASAPTQPPSAAEGSLRRFPRCLPAARRVAEVSPRGSARCGCQAAGVAFRGPGGFWATCLGGLRRLLAPGSELVTSALPPRPALGGWASRRAGDLPSWAGGPVMARAARAGQQQDAGGARPSRRSTRDAPLPKLVDDGRRHKPATGADSFSTVLVYIEALALDRNLRKRGTTCQYFP